MPSERKRARSRSPRRKEERRDREKRREERPTRQDRKRKKDDAEEPEAPRKETRKEEGERSRSPPARPPPPAQEEGSAAGDGGGENVSLSIDETNKLREKLGLKPLEVDTGPTLVEAEDGSGDVQVTEEGKTFTHRAPGNWGDKKRQETIREKLALAKEKRRVLERLGGSGLADDAEDDSAAAWVERTRLAAEEKRQAAERAAALEAMDAEFGVGQLVEGEAKKKKEKAVRRAEKRLPGFTVEHSKMAFMEGADTILVLKDKDVLDEDDGETLVNPTMVEQEQWKRNTEMRKRKPGYNPYDELVDEDGNLRQRGILDKYDEEALENGGLKPKETFTIGESGDVDVGPEKRLADIKAKLRASKAALASSADSGKYELAREYYTPEEMATFKKPRKKKDKKGLRKKGALKATDLVTSSVAPSSGDFGSRDRGRGRVKAEHEGDEDGTAAETPDGLPTLPPAVAPSDSDSDGEMWGPSGDLALDDDEAEDELAAVLDRARKLKATTVVKMEGEEDAVDHKAEEVARLVSGIPVVKVEPEDAIAEEEDDKVITMDATSEYCRGLGEIPTLQAPPTEADPEEEEKSKKKHKKSKKDRKRSVEMEMDQSIDDEEASRTKWVSVDSERVETKPSPSKSKAKPPKKRKEVSSSSEEEEEDEAVLGREESASASVMATIRLAATKGYLEGRKGGAEARRMAELDCQRKTVIDKSMADMDDKYSKKLERMGMGGGPTRSFDDKRDYEPTFNLSYCDETGRPMTTKEAFRYQSWKFHGKMPGKMKTEKRRIKLAEKEKLSHAESWDTPLATLAKQKEKQAASGLPYIQLSGPQAITLPKD